MLLALDARNNSVTVGFMLDGAWLPLTRLGVDRTADEYAFLLEAALGRARGARTAGAAEGESSRAAIDHAWLSSVVPVLTPRLASGVRLAFGLDAAVVGPGTHTGVKIRTDQPSEVGSDLVCQAAAAFAMAGGPCIIVDFGTALTLTAVNGQGELMGVAIAPGLETAATALRRSAAQLPAVRLVLPERAIGRNSAASVRAGLILGYGGLVERLVTRMREELGGQADIIGTGDELGKLTLEGIACLAFVPDLTLDGIALIADRNRPA